jgi:hypothetical protein
MPILVLSLALLASAQDQLEFVDGDPGRLRARLVKAAACADDAAGTVLTVEVANPGALHAEPLEFALDLRGREEALAVERVGGRRYGRAGRAVPARGKRTYLLVAPVARADVRGARVRVAAASFFRGAPVDDPPVRVASRRVDRMQDAALGPLPRTLVTLENTADRSVDAIFRATIRRPVAGTTLLQRHLAPGETVEWEVAESPFGATRYVGAEVTKLELVDWSVVRDDARARAAELLAGALARWRRWPADAPALAGRVILEQDGARREGAFVVRAGRVTVEDAGDEARQELERLFRIVRAAPLPTEGDVHLARRGPRARIGAEGEGVDVGGQPAALVEVEGGRVVATWGHPETGRERWDTRTAGDGWLLTGTFHDHAGTRHVRRFAYEQVAGLHVPVALEESWTWPTLGRRKVVRITLRDVRVHRGGEARLDDGPAAQAVRAAWDGVYRHPDAVRTGRIRVRYPADHAEWRGVRKVEADFRLSDAHDHFAVLDGKLAEEAREALGFLIGGRLSMWRGVDFAATRPFAEVFAGATFSGEDGDYAVKDAPFTRVEVRDGRVHALTLADGRRRVYEWRKVGDAWVVAKAKMGDEEFRVRWRRLRSGYIAPVRIEIENRFGPDWGVEVLELTYDD